MSSREIGYWKEFFSIYPFTQDREDARMAQISFMISSANGGKTPFETFLPKYVEEDIVIEEKSLEQQEFELAIFKANYTSLQQR